MSTIKQFQHKRLLTSTLATQTSSFLRPPRPFVPLPIPTSERVPPITQEQLDYAARFGHSFTRIPLFPPASQVTYESKVDQAPVIDPGNQVSPLSACTPSVQLSPETTSSEEHANIDQTPYLGYSFANIPLFPTGQRKAVLPSPFQEENQLQSRISAARSNGHPLAKQAQQRLEQGLGTDLSGVRVHTDAEADRLSRSIQAEAFTTGPDIFFSAGAYHPSSSQGLHLLAHEVAHVVQQAAGPVAGEPYADGVIISNPDDRFERAAEADARRMSAVPIRKPSFTGSGVSMMPQLTASQPHSAVQRKLAVDGKVVSEADANKIWQDTAVHLNATEQKEAEKIFWNWVRTSGTQVFLGMRVRSGMDKEYQDVESLAAALKGEVTSRENLQRETKLALLFYKDKRIISFLQSLMRKIHVYVTNLQSSQQAFAKAQGNWKDVWARWGPWKIGGGVEAALKQPYSDIPHNFATIRMVALALFGEVKIMPVNYPANKGGAKSITEGDVRTNTMSLKEENEWVKDARSRNIPLQAGPSGTSNRMFLLAQEAKATPDEMLALAWSAVIFFNQDYAYLANNPHRLHEIMDVASHYGVKYNVKLYEDFLSEGPQLPIQSKL